MSRPAIEVSGLSKRYVIEHESRHDNLRDTLHHTARKLWRRFRWGTGFTKEEFWALRDVSFSVQPGEVVGIIGRNGAGKSTLLKILSRITEATSGKVTLRGRVASLLEVGTGFHPDLTGRENIFLNGAILGMGRAEIRSKFDEIVAFAEIERFLDTPVKRYSSGMYVRLAFAVAAHLEPEILIIDEVLAVGDAQFQKKCLGKMQSVASTQGRTVFFVSHNAAAISRLCVKGLLLQQGRVAFWGSIAQSLDAYAASFIDGSETMGGAFQIIDQRIAVNGVRVDGSSQRTIHWSAKQDCLRVALDFTVTEPLKLSVEARLLDQAGGCIAFFCPGHSDPDKNVIRFLAGSHTLTAEVQLPALHQGAYQMDVAIVRPGVCYYARAHRLCVLHHEGTPTASGSAFLQSVEGAGYMVLSGRILEGRRSPM